MCPIYIIDKEDVQNFYSTFNAVTVFFGESEWIHAIMIDHRIPVSFYYGCFELLNSKTKKVSEKKKIRRTVFQSQS